MDPCACALPFTRNPPDDLCCVICQHVCHCTHHCRCSRYMSRRPSRGTRSVGRRTSRDLWPGRGRCRSHTCPSHCRSCHQVSCSGAGTTLWTAYTHHPPGWGKEWRSVFLCSCGGEGVKLAAICVCFKTKNNTSEPKYLCSDMSLFIQQQRPTYSRWFLCTVPMHTQLVQ